MPKSDVLQLVTDLSNGQADATATSNFYDDVLVEMALDPEFPWFVNATRIDTQAGFPTVDIQLGGTLPTRLEPITVAYDDIHIPKSTVRELWYMDPLWRTARGPAQAWLDDEQQPHKFRLYPSPLVDSYVIGDTFSGTAANNAVDVIYREDRSVATPPDPHVDEELMIALDICAREFARDSDHTDHAAAQVFEQLAHLCKALLIEARLRSRN